MQEQKQDLKVMIGLLALPNRAVMQQIYDLVEKRKHTDELLSGDLVKGSWDGSTFYLRHNKVGKKQGKWIYFRSKNGEMLEVETKTRKYFFGDNIKVLKTKEMLVHIEKMMDN